MRESTARAELAKALRGIQKLRSNMFEDGYTEDYMALYEPFAFGGNCILQLLARMDDASSITPVEYWNARWLISQSRLVVAMAGLTHWLMKDMDYKILSGWEEEAAGLM